MIWSVSYTVKCPAQLQNYVDNVYDELVTRVDEELSRLGNNHLKTVNNFTARDLVRPGDKTIAAAGQTVDTVTVGRALGLGRDIQRTLQIHHLLKPWRQHWQQHKYRYS